MSWNQWGDTSKQINNHIIETILRNDRLDLNEKADKEIDLEFFRQKTLEKYLPGVLVTDPTEDRLLNEIKESHYKLYEEQLSDHEAYVKLEKMRIDIDRDIAMRKNP